MTELERVHSTFLHAQSVFEEFIRRDDSLKGHGRVGFMATEICLIVLEDTRAPLADMCESLAGVFHSLSRERITDHSRGNTDLLKTFEDCESAAKSLAAIVRNDSVQQRRKS